FAPTGPRTVDVGCAPLGGVITADGLCRNQYVTWDNIVDEEKRYQLYAEGNYDLTDDIRVHVEALYALTDVPSVNTTPSFATSRGPTETVLPPGFASVAAFMTAAPDVPNASNFFYVPRTNPGFAAYCTTNPAQCPAGTAGAIIQVGQWRPFFLGGNPLFDGAGSYFRRRREQIRVSAGLSGGLGELGFLGAVNWDANLTWSVYHSDRAGFDSVTGRLELALRGLGGPGCNPATGTPGAGSCFYLNPFSNAIAGNPNLGLTNPGFNSAVANTNKELIAWFFQPADRAHGRTGLWEGNLILNGESTLKLPGGAIGYAVGAQWRRNENSSSPESQSSTADTPCADTLINGSTTCSPKPFSPFIFVGNINPNDVQRDIYAGFFELNLPIFDSLNVQLAGRYEDYGRYGGSTFNPQARAKWQVADWLAFRGSVGTTFRAPPLVSLIADTTVTLQNIFGTFKPVEITGNPALTPEKAFTYSVGAIFHAGRLRTTVDYWYFKLQDILTTEPQQAVLNVAFPTAAAVANCADPFVAAHFTFTSAVCSAPNIATVRLSSINGPEVRTSGIDLLTTYDVDGVMGGALQVGGSLSFIMKYDVAALVINGVTFAPALKAVGFYNTGTVAYPLPQWKAEVYAEFNRGPHNLRWTTRYIDDYIDQRTANYTVTTANTQVTPAPTVATQTLVTRGKKIDSQVQHDLAYRAFLPWDVTLSIAIQNVFNTDPPFARTELSYEPLTGNPLGRTYQIGLRKKF
ncbi:MAG: TonB-dependent receptor, partial [Phenylobacterium sp.]